MFDAINEIMNLRKAEQTQNFLCKAKRKILYAKI